MPSTVPIFVARVGTAISVARRKYTCLRILLWFLLSTIAFLCVRNIQTPLRQHATGRRLKPSLLTFAKVGDYGRLGNQIFQVASTIGIAESNGLEWQFPERIYQTSVGKLFTLKGELSHTLVASFPRHNEITETFYDVQLLSDDGKAMSLHGYFQWPQYFEHSMNTLRSELRVNSKLIHEVYTHFPELRRHRSVAVHVRRGDYVKLDHIYNLLPSSYYLAALSSMAFDHVYIVTDDKKWCLQMLVPKIQSKNVTVSDLNDELLDFTLLYLSDNIVISSSSFSWWAAFLKELSGVSHNRSVVAPKSRYNPSGSHAYLNSDKYYPEHWRLISSFEET